MPGAAHLRRLREALDAPTTLGDLNERLGHEGAGLMVFLLALPFLQPIPLAGLGTPVGIVLIAIGARLARGRRIASLPGFVARRRLEAATIARLLSAAEQILAFVERVARPRRRGPLRSPRALGAAIVVLGVIYAVPIFVPLGNPVTAAPLALIGLALLEEDGLLGALGLAGTLLTAVYHAAFLYAVWGAAQAASARLS